MPEAGVEDAILCCPMCVYKFGVFTEGLFAILGRVVERGADVAIWDAKHLVAKLHVCRRGDRAVKVAARRAAGVDAIGRMVALLVC